MVLFLIHFFLVKKLKCTYWYDTKFFAIFLFISIGFMVFCNLLYTFNIIRYIFITMIFIVVIVLFIKNREKVIYAIKNKTFEGLLKKEEN